MTSSIRFFLGVEATPDDVPFEILSSSREDGYSRQLIVYGSPDGDKIKAFLFLPEGKFSGSAVLVHHQHNSGRRFGKSEVAGLVGDPLQAFGPALARRGIVALAPDSICFEDRRREGFLSDSDDEPGAFQHYLEMSYRLVNGDSLMRKVLSDAALGLSLLRTLAHIDPGRVGVAGHSMGGNTAIFQAATDHRVSFACCSGALASYRTKIRSQTGLEMALIIPGFLQEFDMVDVVRAIAPRPLLVLSASRDSYSADAEQIVAEALKYFSSESENPTLEHCRFEGEHGLDLSRFNRIVDWLSAR